MYAVIKTGGKKYRVKNGDIIEVEKLTADAGSTISLSPVLMFNDDKSSKVGTPILEGCASGGGGGDCGSSVSADHGTAGGSGVVIIKEPSATVKTAPGMWTLNEVYDQVKQGIWTN